MSLDYGRRHTKDGKNKHTQGQIFLNGIYIYTYSYMFRKVESKEGMRTVKLEEKFKRTKSAS